ncbi:MAG: 4-(cytidine 5'-diphospho)-2-C-methyl-D-erythritol kinase [Alphaproteobacteria bacterium]
MTRLIAAAPAKINLFLHVTGRREDGYHLLDSLIVFAGISDEVSAAPAGTLILDEVTGPFGGLVGPAQDNLVLRAAEGLARLTGRSPPPGAALRLYKTLPAAAGIGGGSADAAATLRLLCALWGLTPRGDDLESLARRLGADVPVCLAGQAARASGIGDELAPVGDLPPLWLVLVNPGVAVPTPAVFARRQGAFTEPALAAAAVAGGRDRAAFIAALRETRNDLLAPALELAPEIGDVLAAIQASEGCLLARMSGSGATCFGLFGTAEEAAAAAGSIGRDAPAWWVAAGPMISDIAAELPLRRD